MLDPDLELETELRQLRPRHLSEASLRKLELAWVTRPSALSLPPHRSQGYVVPFGLSVRRTLAWSCAAIFLINVIWFSFRAPALDQKASASFRPAATDNLVIKSVDEGVVILNDGTSARRYRINSIDTVTWTNPDTHASLRWTLPREDVRIVPVQVY